MTQLYFRVNVIECQAKITLNILSASKKVPDFIKHYLWPDMVSVIIPFINENNHLSDLIKQLTSVVAYGHEIILVDGGSSDGFKLSNAAEGVTLCSSSKGRSKQMNYGAGIARGDVFWFLHADTILQFNVMHYVALIENMNSCWGRFNVSLSGSNSAFKLIAAMMNIRSSLTGISTGDQGIFIGRKLFDVVKGYDEIEIMEDIGICKKLKKLSSPMSLQLKLTTSSRRWQEKGILKTILTMWLMRVLFFIGIKPSTLIKIYEK